MKECAKYGITSVHDAGMGRGTIDAVRSLAAKNALLIRIYAMIDSGGYIDVLPVKDEDIFRYWSEQGPLIDTLDGHLTVRAAKLFMWVLLCDLYSTFKLKGRCVGLSGGGADEALL